MYKFLIIILIPLNLFAYDFSFKKGDNVLELDFEDKSIKEIKFDVKINDQRNFVHPNMYCHGTLKNTSKCNTVAQCYPKQKLS